MNKELSAFCREATHLLSTVYDQGEAESLVNVLAEDLLGISRQKRLTRTHVLDAPTLDLLHQALARLMRHEPIQHIVGFAYFLDRKFVVTPDTLIPRPETEELVALVIQQNQQAVSILDIGTGSGCIAISLAAELPQARVSAWDFSEAALTIARQNAAQHQVQVDFRQQDALAARPDQQWEVIVSNPPYIPRHEKAEMQRNVTGFEPDSALFVPDDDPLLFYRAIARLGQTALPRQGKLYFEIHEKFGALISDLLIGEGYTQVMVHQDLQGKDRMVQAVWPHQPPSGSLIR